MKFQKFVKSIGSDGIIYIRKNEEKWLASESVFMKIPEEIRSITAKDIIPMPEALENIIDHSDFTEPCTLSQAIMPEANGAIKDCIRIYATKNNLDRVAITNTAYTLIERKDCVEIYLKIDNKSAESEALALVVKEFKNLQEDPVTVGVILRTIYEH